MAQRTCSLPGCEKPHRARGLCAYHWRLQYGKRKTIEVECPTCGKATTKRDDGDTTRRFCSLACRDEAWPPGAHLCKVYFGTCLVCERSYCTRRRESICCSVGCTRRLELATRPRRTQATPAHLTYRRECAWCSALFVTPQPHHAYCGRACRTKAARLRRRAREHGSFGSYTWSDFMRLAQRFDFRCAYCGERDGQLDPDHVVPLSRGGFNSVANLLPSCHACNCDKRDLLLDEWALDRVRRRLPPRATSWAAEDKRFWHLTQATLAA